MGNGVAAEGNGPLPGPEGSAAAARLRGLRARLGLSQEQLARELGVSFATVNRWESGLDPDVGPGRPGHRGVRGPGRRGTHLAAAECSG